MKHVKAFTLIELLVVIAIIAILAAILFPTFAQAKLSAKAAASISNIKQLSMAQVMYGADNDDLFVPVSYLDSTAPVGFSSYYIRTWSQIIYPYFKTADILLDPLTQPGDYSWGTRQWVIAYDPQYGYNFETMSPVTGYNVTSPMSQTSLASVSSTVMMASKATPYREYTPAYDAASGGALDSSFTIGAPWCNMSTGMVDGSVTPQSWCNYLWPGYVNSWGYDAGNGMSFESGGYTGLVSMRKAGKGIVAFADGHAKIMGDTELAAGTNYSKTQAPSSLVITDLEKYLWDAN